MSERYDADHEESLAENKAFYDRYRGSIAGDVFANAMTIAGDVGLGALHTLNTTWALAVDRQSGDQFKARVGFALTHPGAVWNQTVLSASDFIGEPLDE